MQRHARICTEYHQRLYSKIRCAENRREAHYGGGAFGRDIYGKRDRFDGNV